MVLFDRPGISVRRAARCICRVLVFASSWLLGLVCLLTVGGGGFVGELEDGRAGRAVG